MRNIGNAWASGNGIFETIRVEDGQVFALHRHHCRAEETAKRINISIPNEEQVTQASYQIINSENYSLGRLRWHFSVDGEFSISYTAYEDPQNPARLMLFDERKGES